MDRINIIGTLFDNSIEHVVALANQIKDLRLEKNQQDINEDIYDKIDSYINNLQNQILDEKNRAEQTESYISNKLNSLEQTILNKDSIKHVFLTQEQYDALNNKYEKDTLYFIIERQISGSGSRFGDTFPLTFGQASSCFGDPFPLILG